METDDYVTVTQAARIARVQPETIRRWCSGQNPRLPFSRTAGGHRRIRLTDLDALMHAGPEKSSVPRFTDLAAAADVWQQQLDDFATWRPARHMSDDQLARLRNEIAGFDGNGGLVGDLRRIAERITEELGARDQQATERHAG